MRLNRQIAMPYNNETFITSLNLIEGGATCIKTYEQHA